MPIQRCPTLLLILCFAVLSSVGAETPPNSTRPRSRHGAHVSRLHPTLDTPEYSRAASGKRRTCSVVEYGAVGDGVFMSTPFIQAAIDACASEEGGAVVLFPPGMYLTGTIFVKSNITLYIAKGATVLGSAQQKDFPPDAARWYTILAENASNVAITGINCRSSPSCHFKLTLKLRTTISCASDMIFSSRGTTELSCGTKGFEFDFQHEDKL